MVSEKLKSIVFKKLSNDLSHVEIIPFNDSIFFIDRKNRYWYFEFDKEGTLWWRDDFFGSFFSLFSLDIDVYNKLICEWVEKLLNENINECLGIQFVGEDWDEVINNVLKFKVNKNSSDKLIATGGVDEILNNPSLK